MSLQWQACVIHPCWVCVYISVCMCCAWQQKQAWQWWMSTRKAESQHRTQRCRAGNDPRRYCHNPQRQREPTGMRTGVKKATHITKHVALNGSAIVEAFKSDLWYAFPFRLALSKGGPLLFSLRMWHMYSPSFTGNNVCCLNHSSAALHGVSQGWSDSSADKWQLERVAKFQPVWIALGPKTLPEQIW